MSASVSYVVEGGLDDAVLRRLLRDNDVHQGIGQAWLNGKAISAKGQPITLQVEGHPVTLTQQSGKALVNEVAQLVNPMCKSKKWVALRDLDYEFPCAGAARSQWLPNPGAYMCFRIAVHSVEAWLLADRERIAYFLDVDIQDIPPDPDRLPDALSPGLAALLLKEQDRNPGIQLNPKLAMLLLAEQSRNPSVRSRVVKRSGNQISEGRFYTQDLSKFVKRPTLWRPGVAANNSHSLAGCLQRLKDLAEGKPVN